jgi:hypothetical protein
MGAVSMMRWERRDEIHEQSAHQREGVAREKHQRPIGNLTDNARSEAEDGEEE